MRLVNPTPFEALLLPTVITRARAVLVIVVKATLRFQDGDGGAVELDPSPLPIQFGDDYNDREQPGSIRFEDDLAPFKRRADVVLNGHGYAPGGRPVTSMKVGFKLGALVKTLRVVGDRHWAAGGGVNNASFGVPAPFTKLPLVYENAYGGVDDEACKRFEQNPVGRGYLARFITEQVDKTALPNIETDAALIRAWDDRPQPAGFGFIAKNWQPRLALLGTYDEDWKKTRAPDRPADFSADFFNAAPADQQVAGYLRGDEDVDLLNVTPRGRCRFRLPGYGVSAAVTLSDDGGEQRVTPAMHLDTLCLLPDDGRLYLVWRGNVPISEMAAPELRRVELAQTGPAPGGEPA